MELLNTSTNTIWRYSRFYKRKISENNAIFLQENMTKLEQKGQILLKREDQSIVGSHKFRPLTYQFACLLEDGIGTATISSSGNAAITMSKLSAKHQIKSFIFISPKTPAAKKAQIDQSNSLVIESTKALRLSNYLSKKMPAAQLRASKDDSAIEGYKSLGFELHEQNPDIDAIFFFISSGASLLGSYEAYQQLLHDNKINKLPAIHVVLANEQPENFLAGSCARTKLRRAKAINNAISESKGQTWQLSNDDLSGVDFNSSAESHAAYTACRKALEKYNYKNPVVICSGREWPEAPASDFQKLETFEEIDKLINLEKLHL